MFRVKLTVAVMALIAMTSTAVAQDQPPTITLDGTQGTNPSSPAPGKFVVTGGYNIPSSQPNYTYTLTDIKVKYVLQGSQLGWIAVSAAINTTNQTWSDTESGLAGGTYLVHAVLIVKVTDRNTGAVTSREIPTPTRSIDVVGAGGCCCCN